MKTQLTKYLVMSIFVFITALSFSQAISGDKEAVAKVLDNYKKALERLDIKGTENLFAESSMVIESGKVEGTYKDYLAHHIGPELGDFKSFQFENYKVEVTVAGNYAFAVETYNYSIVLIKDNTEIKRKGVATSFLKKENRVWRILNMHNSSRKP
ncbi:MAG: nuclear transport factor 2 family protein [Cytophagales bacterium]|nr:nuclear transport factor 2 family protein [Cytophagales bacterium]